MAVSLIVAGVETQATRGDYLLITAVIENVGTENIGPGTVIARQTLEDGSICTADFFNTIALSPGGKAKVKQLLRGGVRELAFRTYKQADGESIPLSGLLRRSLIPASVANATESFFADVLTSLQQAGVRLYDRIRVGTANVISRTLRAKARK